MSTIRRIYQPNGDGSANPPNFPATDQHPAAVRYTVAHALGALVIDAIGGVPTLAEIDAVLGRDAAGQAAAARIAADEQERAECKLDATIIGLVDQTRAQWRTWAGTNFPTLTAPERTRLGDLFWVVSIGVRQRLRNGG